VVPKQEIDGDQQRIAAIRWLPMSVGLFNNAKHWQERAQEARVHAEQLTDPAAKRIEQLTDPAAKRMMLEIAESYQRFAKKAQERQLSAGAAELRRSPL
jgi:hypothetical protein